MTKKVLGRACKHAFQTFHKWDKDRDLITAKIETFYDDGTSDSDIHLIEDFKRPFYIVLEKYRTFKQNRDYIELSKVKKFKSNQSRLAYNITKALGRPDRNAKLSMVLNNNYVFGCQEAAAVVFKQLFYDKYNEYQTKAYYRVGAYDVETYIEADGSTGQVNMASITCNDQVYWCGARSFFKEDEDDETIYRKLREAQEKYLDQDYIKKHNVKFTYKLVNTPGEIVVNCIQAFHRIAPDYIVSWNANFDMKANQDALLAEGFKPEKVYSDPRIPDAYQGYDYYPGREFKRKVDGTMSPLDPQERFPVLRAPASWQWFDGMSFYAISRTAGGKKDSYSLQNTAIAEKIPGKLYTKEGEQYTNGSVDWHKYMQKHHPYIYAMYNIQDNFVIEDLNRATNDYSLALPSLITSSELKSYQSQPTLISDELSFIALKHGYVWGTVGQAKSDEFKKYKPDLKDWIALLHTELNEDNGYQLYEGLYSVKSRGHAGVSDIDVSSGYPSITIALNVSNKTTKIEVCQVQGLDRLEFRQLGVNYASSPKANASLLAKTIFGIPELTEIETFYKTNVLPFIESGVVKEPIRTKVKQNKPVTKQTVKEEVNVS